MAARDTNAGKGSYVGKIGNAGSQVVEAPLTPGPKNKHSVVRTGADLRSGKTGGGRK